MSSPTSAFRWLFGRCVLDEAELELRVEGVRVELERKPLEVLRYLLRHAGEVVTKDELQNAIWAGRILSETVLTKAVSRVREVLGDDEQTIIKTVHGYGYRLVAPVTVEAITNGSQPVLGLKAGDAPPGRPQWRLEAHLDSGSSGEVWRALHGKTGEARVFKFALQAEALDSIKREITLFRLLRQQLGEEAPIAEVLDWNLEDAPYFLELRRYEHGSLRDCFEARGRLSQVPLAERLALFVRLAEAVAAVHGVGVLHKDLKPANVLIKPGSGGVLLPVLADFGGGGVLAEDLIANAGITQLGFTRRGETGAQGTALYLAPEVLEGQPLTLKSDLYALGVILYQLCVGDFKKAIASGWEHGIDDALLKEDIALAVRGNPAHRIDSAAELAERLRRLPERHLERAEQERQAALASQAEARVKAAQVRIDRIRMRRKWMILTMAVFLVGALSAGWFAWHARQANVRTQAAMSFLLDDVLGGFSLKQGPAKHITVNSLIERAAAKLDERFPASDVAGRAQAYSALWGLYGISDHSTVDFEFSSGLQQQMLAATLAWFKDDPDRAYGSAYRIAVDIDFWNNDAVAAALTDAVARHAATNRSVPVTQRLHLAARQAEESLKQGHLKQAVAEMQALSEPFRAQAATLVHQEPFALFTAVNTSTRLGLTALGESLCKVMQDQAGQPPLADDATLRLEYLTACTVAANARGDADTALWLAREGLALARANYDDLVGYVPTFLRFEGSAELALSHYPAAFAALDQAAALRRKLDDGLLPYVLVVRGTVSERLGQEAAALADYREASDDLRDETFPLLAAEAHSRYARLLALEGRGPEAATALARIPESLITELPPGHRTLASIDQARAAIAASRGDRDTARQQLAAADGLLQAIGYPEAHDWRREIASQLAIVKAP